MAERKRQAASLLGRVPAHHPPTEMLLDYATGALAPAWSAAIAAHLTYCPHCRDQVRSYEALGGMALEDAGATEVADGALAAVMARLDEPEAPRRRASGHAILPAPLQDYFELDSDPLPWRRVMPGLEEIRAQRPGPKVSLLRIAPGRAMPRHTHGGDEMTLVLRGGFTDALGEFRRGDLALVDGSVDHKPVAMEDEACICLAVTEAPLRLSGPIGRLFNSFVRF